MTRKKNDWVQLWYRKNDVFLVDPRTTVLRIACCDCGSAHDLDMIVRKDGQIQFTLRKDERSTNALRKAEQYDFVPYWKK